MKKRLFYTVIIFCLVLVSAFYLHSKSTAAGNSQTVTRDNTSQVSQQVSTPTGEPDAPKLNSSTPAPLVDEADEEISAEVIATRSMVIAHEPLRVSSVADPDSQENKAILQAMVLKALDNETAPKN